MVNVKNIIEELDSNLNVDRQDFFVSLVSRRLDTCLESYYSDLKNKYNSLEDRVYSNEIRVMKKL